MTLELYGIVLLAAAFLIYALLAQGRIRELRRGPLVSRTLFLRELEEEILLLDLVRERRSFPEDYEAGWIDAVDSVRDVLDSARVPREGRDGSGYGS